jgi:hypothetical protein
MASTGEVISAVINTADTYIDALQLRVSELEIALGDLTIWVAEGGTHCSCTEADTCPVHRAQELISSKH